MEEGEVEEGEVEEGKVEEGKGAPHVPRRSEKM